MKHDGLKIGIVAIQGDYDAHAKVLERLSVSYTFVRTPADLAGLAGVILPGGESTTHLKVMTEEGLFEALKKFAAADGTLALRKSTTDMARFPGNGNSRAGPKPAATAAN